MMNLIAGYFDLSPGGFFSSFLVLGLSAVLGGLIGVERQIRQRAVGVRTNALVALGAASFTLFAALLPNPGADSIARVAAQVVSGIGFLGAGVIMRDGLSVSGLTTAATLWCSAAVGVLAGAHMFELASMTTAAIVFVNLLFRPLSKAIDARHKKELMSSKVIISISCQRSNLDEISGKIEKSLSDIGGRWVSCRSEEQPHRPSVNSEHQVLLFIEAVTTSNNNFISELSSDINKISSISTFSISVTE